MTEYNIKYYADINSISQVDWDDLAGNSSIFYNYGWFKIFSQIFDQPLFIAAYKNNKLVGVIPGFITSNPNTYLYHNHRDALFCRNESDLINYLGRKGRKRKSFALKSLAQASKVINPVINRFLYPAFIGISPRGFIGDILCEDELVADFLLKSLDQWCIDNKIKSKSFLWVENDNNNLNKCLSKYRFLNLIGEMDFHLDIKWNTFDDFISNISHSKRRQIKYDMKIFEQHELSVEDHHGSEAILNNIEVVADLLYENALSNGDLLSQYFHYKDLLLNMVNHLSENLYSVLVKDKDHNIVGIAIFLLKNDILYPKMFGYNQAFSKQTGMHFNAVYYSSIKKAIDAGIKKIKYGSGGVETKLRRGCQVSYLTCYYDIDANWLLKSILAKYMKLVSSYKLKTYKEILV